MNLAANINGGLILAIIALLLVVRRLDTLGNLKWLFKKPLARGFYIVAVLVLGFIAGCLAYSPFNLIHWNKILIGGILHAGAASILYQTGKLAMPSEKDFKFFHEEKNDQNGS